LAVAQKGGKQAQMSQRLGAIKLGIKLKSSGCLTTGTEAASTWSDLSFFLNLDMLNHM